MSARQARIGRKPCGCIVSVCVLDHPDAVREFLAEAFENNLGAVVEDYEAAKTEPTFFACPHGQDAGTVEVRP